MRHSKEEILEHLFKVLAEMFEVEEELLSPEANLADDLDLDSIDSIELLIELKDFIGRDVDANEFSEVKTVDEMVNIIIEIEKQMEDA